MAGGTWRRAHGPPESGLADADGAPFASSWRRAHLTVDQRVARGRAARREAPRSEHGRWEPAPDRPDPVALLEEQAATRVPELVPIRYGRMLVSPFTFYRGAAAIMAADLAATPVSGITVQLCGDAHLSNFGVFGTPERQLIFDINDFDETLPGPWEWDVKRMAASFEIMGRFRGFSPDNRHAIVTAGVREYRERMRRAAGHATLGAWYDQLEAGVLLNLVRQQVRVKQLDKKSARRAEKHVAKAYASDSARVFAKRAAEVGRRAADRRRPAADHPDRGPDRARDRVGGPGAADQEAARLLPADARVTRVIRWRSSATSTPRARWWAWAASAPAATSCCSPAATNDDPLFLQVKEAQASVLEPYAGRSTYPHHGQRVVMGQRLMQAATDIFLGWQRIKGLDGVTRDYYVRQFHDWKGSADVERLPMPGAAQYARFCGATLARAHARWGDRIAIASYLGQGDMFDRAIAEFSAAYADQNERDYQAFAAAVNSGRLIAQTGV